MLFYAKGFNEVGGIEGLWDKYPNAVGKSLVNSTINATLVNGTNYSASCYGVEKHWNHMFRPLDDSEYPWLGLVFSLPVTGIWYWCTDQVIVQRTLGAKSMVHARLGTILAGFLKLLPLFIMVMPGMVARVLFPDIIGCSDPASCKLACGNEYGCSNEAYPRLVMKILPTGLVGLMLAVMVAALMSSLSSAFNSSSTIFTMDIYRVLKPKASNRELLIVGRVVVLVLVAVGLAWIPVVSQGHGGQLFKYLQTIQSYLAPPTCAVFLVGILWPKLTEAGGLTSMLFGLMLGIVRLSMDVVYPQPHCGQVDTRPSFVRLHFMYYALIIFFACIVIMVVVSFFTRPAPLEMLGALTWPTINRPRYMEGQTSGEYVVTVDVNRDQVKMSGGTPGVSMEGLTPSEDELREIDEFEHQSNLSKWGIRGAAFALVFALLFLWIWYR